MFDKASVSKQQAIKYWISLYQ